MGHLAERDFGPTYGATLTINALRAWNIIQYLRSSNTSDRAPLIHRPRRKIPHLA
jgi:hypothetical protein